MLSWTCIYPSLCLIFCIHTRDEILEWGTVLEEPFALSEIFEVPIWNACIVFGGIGTSVIYGMKEKEDRRNNIDSSYSILQKNRKKNQFPVWSEENFWTGRYISVRLIFLNLISFYNRERIPQKTYTWYDIKYQRGAFSTRKAWQVKGSFY